LGRGEEGYGEKFVGWTADVVGQRRYGLLRACLRNQGSRFFVTEAIGVLMKEKKIDGLTKMYGLFARNNGLKILCAHFKAHIQVGNLARRWNMLFD
jgi:hypothetical protein